MGTAFEETQPLGLAKTVEVKEKGAATPAERPAQTDARASLRDPVRRRARRAEAGRLQTQAWGPRDTASHPAPPAYWLGYPGQAS